MHLPRVISLLGPTSQAAILGAGRLALLGVPLGVEILRSALTEHWRELDSRSLRYAIMDFTTYLTRADKEQDGIAEIEPIIEQAVRESEWTAEDQALVLNQLQKLYFGARRFDEALRVGERVLTLMPNDLTYLYNVSLIYRKLNLASKAAELVDRSVEVNIDGMDEDHLSNAAEVYALTERGADVRTIFERLQGKYPKTAAALLRRSSKVRQSVDGSA